MQESKHTPTPWKISDGHAVGAVTIRQDGGEFQNPVAELWHNGDDHVANAAFIVRAVNNHDALVDALRMCVYRMDGEYGFDGPETDAARAALAALD